MGDYLTEWFHYREETLKADAVCINLNASPCIWKITDETELHHYIPLLNDVLNAGNAKQAMLSDVEDFLKKYMVLFQQIKYYELVSPDGFRSFYNGQIEEIGVSIPATKEDLRTTQERLNAHTGNELEIVPEEDSSAVPSTRNFCLFPIDGVDAFCAFPAWDASFIIRITDPEITKAFEGWYHAMWQISAMTRVIRATQAG